MYSAGDWLGWCTQRPTDRVVMEWTIDHASAKQRLSPRPWQSLPLHCLVIHQRIKNHAKITQWMARMHLASIGVSLIGHGRGIQGVSSELKIKDWYSTVWPHFNVKFPTVRGTQHVKCYSYHARTSTKHLYGCKYAAYNKQF